MPDSRIYAHFNRTHAPVGAETLPTGSDWVYELKFDGFRAEAIKSGGKTHLR